MAKPIYGHVKTSKDIVRINKKIRSQIKKAKSRPTVTELVRRSRFLVTLTYSPAWKKAGLSKLRKTAKREYRKTVKTANQVVRKVGGKPYGTKRSRKRRR